MIALRNRPGLVDLGYAPRVLLFLSPRSAAWLSPRLANTTLFTCVSHLLSPRRIVANCRYTLTSSPQAATRSTSAYLATGAQPSVLSEQRSSDSTHRVPVATSVGGQWLHSVVTHIVSCLSGGRRLDGQESAMCRCRNILSYTTSCISLGFDWQSSIQHHATHRPAYGSTDRL